MNLNQNGLSLLMRKFYCCNFMYNSSSSVISGLGFGKMTGHCPCLYMDINCKCGRTSRGKVVFCDIDPLTFNIDPNQIEKRLQTKQSYFTCTFVWFVC